MRPGEDLSKRLVTVPDCRVVKLPSHVTLTDAATPVIEYITVWPLFIGKLRLTLPRHLDSIPEITAPKSLLVLGGSSVCGAAVIHMLRIAFSEITLLSTSSARKHARVQGLENQKVFDYKSSTIVRGIIAGSPECDGVDIVIDCVGAGAKQIDIADVLSLRGIRKYAVLATAAMIPKKEDVDYFDIYGREYIEIFDDGTAILTLTELIASGDYKVPLPAKVVGQGLEQIPQVLEQLNSTSGDKLVIML